MVSNKILNNILNIAYKSEVKRTIGLDISDLSFENYQPEIQDFSSSIHNEWQCIDFGLSEENICLYLDCLNKNGITDFCIVRGRPRNIPNAEMHDYAICFGEEAIPSHEEVIKKTENIKAIYLATLGTKNQVVNIKKHLDLSSNQIHNLLHKKINDSLHNRSSMWHEIEEGLRRILGTKPNRCNTTELQEYRYTPIRDYLILTIHGNQLHDFIQTDSYAVNNYNNDIVPDVLVLGHFHIMMIMIRFNTLILFNGHWLNSIYKNEFISHIGSHTFTVGSYIKSRIFRLLPS